MITNNLLKTVTLPYKTVQGSFELRQQKAEQFTHKFVNNISGKIFDNGMSLSQLGRAVKAFVPKNIKVFIKKNNDVDSIAQLNRTFTKNNWIVNQSLEMVPNKNKKIDVSHLPTIAHEIRHLADSLYHPKILSREQKLAKANLDTDKFYNFYDNEIYVTEIEGGKNLNKLIMKDIKHKTEKVLRGYSTRDKINMLQYMRYSLISEYNAYKDEYKLAKKLYKKNQPVFEDVLEDQTKGYMFNEKIKLLKSMIQELITKERGIHKSCIKNNK